MIIYKAELGDQGAKDLSVKVQDLIGSLEGKITKTNFWGKRKFAYEIKHDKEGYYDVVNFELDLSNLDKLKSKMKLLNGVVRYLVTA